MLDAGAGRGKLASPVRSHSLVPENRNRGAASHWPVVFLGGISPLVDPGSALLPSVAVRSTLARPLAALLLSLVGKRGAVTVERLTGRACPHSGG